MRRNPTIREYVPNTHRLDRSARLDHVLTWVQRWVAADGGKATFIGFRRTDARVFNKVRRLLPDQYRSTRSFPKSDEAPTDQPTWRERRDEYRLIVTLETTPTSQPPTATPTGDQDLNP